MARRIAFFGRGRGALTKQQTPGLDGEDDADHNQQDPDGDGADRVPAGDRG